MYLALRAWLESMSEADCERVVKYVYERAISGHFGYFKLIIDVVDGKIRQTAEEELTFEPDCVLIVVDGEPVAEYPKAA
jgi:hypothetical protein